MLAHTHPFAPPIQVMQRFVAAVRRVIYRLRAQKRLRQIKAATGAPGHT
jgi:hypothetical protein